MTLATMPAALLALAIQPLTGMLMSYAIRQIRLMRSEAR